MSHPKGPLRCCPSDVRPRLALPCTRSVPVVVLVVDSSPTVHQRLGLLPSRPTTSCAQRQDCMAGLDMLGSTTSLPFTTAGHLPHQRPACRTLKSRLGRSAQLCRSVDADLARSPSSASSSLSRSQRRELRVACRATAAPVPSLQSQIDDLRHLREDLAQAHTPHNKASGILGLGA